jgi:beta-glucosidase
MEMDSRLYGAELPKLVKDGAVKMTAVDEAVRRILRVKMELGLFEHPYADESRSSGAPDAAAREAERQAAVRTMVLLKNEGSVLPLSKDLKNIAVIGPVADDGAAVLGSWSGDGRAPEAVSVLAGIRAAVPGANVTFAKGADVRGDSEAGFAAALDAARAADAVVLVLGEAGDMTGEASSRASLDLPGRQLELAQDVLALGKPSAVVLLNGRPLTIPWLAENAPAILEAWQPGTEGGRAAADALFGDANPGGKLPMTFPRAVGQVPLYYDHKNTGRPPVDGDHKPTGNPWEDMNHYTSKYLDLDVTPQYPFGYGLSYTTFELSDLKVGSEKIRPDGSVEIRATVRNSGARAGDEVVQLYIRRTSASVTRPVRELKGFSRVSLKPGEKKDVTFTLTPKELAVVGQDMRTRVEPGAVAVFVGDSSVGGLSGRFTIAK